MTPASLTRRGTDATRQIPVPILMYHQVTPNPLPEFRKYAVPKDAFAAQLEWLASHEYVSVSMETLFQHRTAGAPLPPRPVVLTFDDGYQDCLDHAAPVLADWKFTATFYVLGQMAGETSRWLIAERGIELPLLDWDSVRALRAAGHECGSHAMSHTRLTRLTPTQCLDELRDSRRVLEDRLGEETRHLAYPFGDYDQDVRALAGEAGYRTACSVRLGWSEPDDDLLALHRIHVHGEATVEDFAEKLRHRFGPRRMLRAGLRSLRRRLGSR
jgi:peptidoglycan/xylan/chitin deacetylase (PgdA/CDA1 family)